MCPECGEGLPEDEECPCAADGMILSLLPGGPSSVSKISGAMTGFGETGPSSGSLPLRSVKRPLAVWDLPRS